jgi:hypothetical protein
MIELNLLPDVKKEFLKAQRTRNNVISGAIILTIAAAVITAILASTVYIGQNAVIALQTKSVKEKNDKLKSQPEIEKYLTVQNQLKNIDTLHNGKYLYSRALTYLQALNPSTPNNVVLSSVSLKKEDKSLELEGSVRNFEALTIFKTTLQTAKLKYQTANSSDQQETVLFNTVTLADAGIRSSDKTSVVNFRMLLTYPEAIFLTSTKNGKIEVPNEVTSDGDRNAPKELFGAQLEGTR